MSKASFLAQMGIAKMGKIGDAITTALVRFDPETASAAQIAEMDDHANELASRVAQAETQVETDQRQVMQKQDALDRNQQAATILGTRLQAASDANDVALVESLTNKLTPVLNEIEHLGGEDGSGETAGDLFDAKATLQQSLADLFEWQETHRGAVEQLASARDRLRKAHTDMERSAEAQRRSEARRQQAERDAGLRQGLDTTNIALSAMEQAAIEAKQKARAATIQTDVLRHTGSASADDIVAETLASQKPKPASVLDRLAKLKQG